ncbi:hypothetical protein INP83_00035 [Mucilaginibacter sp. 21P]|uniref:hypothetical protein n=1 Tax=Mucilaginibacter sp. 21P TaxID=2778902 RepID=UPI001C56C946|nr:hypothetical protein [Mucilaginibacter sp. 21P]QXV65528.1 hypothetical protein INP83_00035 [Mucilaginibacter sp. 21P]
MKKLLSIICVAILAVTASSCKKETVVSNNTLTRVFDLKSTDWKQTSDGVSWYANLNIPELDNQIHLKGGVLVSISVDGESTYEQIPETFGGVAYSYSHQPGQLQLLAQAYDGANPPISNPGAMTVKVVLIDSND